MSAIIAAEDNGALNGEIGLSMRFTSIAVLEPGMPLRFSRIFARRSWAEVPLFIERSCSGDNLAPPKAEEKFDVDFGFEAQFRDSVNSSRVSDVDFGASPDNSEGGAAEVVMDGFIAHL
jgi:hypothetical protein